MHKELTVKIKKEHPDAKIPLHGSAGAAGYDLYAVAKDELPGNLVAYEIGLAFELPPGYVGLIFPRSSIYTTGLELTNCAGVLDEDYRGTVKAIFRRVHGVEMPGEYQKGDRVAQLVLVKWNPINFVETDKLSATARGTGGYGSTGR